MTALRTMQQQMLQAVIRQSSPPLDIRGDAIADANSRLGIYQHGYRARLCEALGHEFAGLRCLTGRQFEPLLYAYIDACPSQHYNIRWHGMGLADFLKRTRPNELQLAEMAALDWAISTAFDAADEPSPGLVELSSIPAEAWANLQLFLQNNLRWLSETYNVDAFRRAADKGSKRPRLRQLAHPRHFMVWRHATIVHYRRVTSDEHAVLTAAQRGEPFAGLCAILAGFHGESTALARMVTLLQTWLQAGLIRGWQT